MVNSWPKFPHKCQKLKNLQAASTFVVCDKAICYVMSCPLETPMWQRTDRSFQPPANKKPKPRVLQLIRNWILPIAIGAEGTHLGDRNILSLDWSFDYICAHIHGTVHLRWIHSTICKGYLNEVAFKNGIKMQGCQVVRSFERPTLDQLTS